jgi:mRNA interferase HigB
LSTAQVQRIYPTATIESADRIAFNIKGDSHRLVVAVDFEKRIVFVRWIGTAEAYARLAAGKVKDER